MKFILDSPASLGQEAPEAASTAVQHACNPGTQEAEVQGSEGTQLELSGVLGLTSNTRKKVVVVGCILTENKASRPRVSGVGREKNGATHFFRRRQPGFRAPECGEA